MKANGKLANRALFASVTIILFLLVIGGVTQRMLTNQKKVTAAEERRYQSRLLADELRQSSDDLTRLARTYVVTADKRSRAVSVNASASRVRFIAIQASSFSMNQMRISTLPVKRRLSKRCGN